MEIVELILGIGVLVGKLVLGVVYFCFMPYDTSQMD